ncbi:acyl-CoA-binding domain-containing protein 1 isoform X3 [Physcomitrium patens]|uniref:acyl-CoA-binding domain-containing protein 1 isoform X3 n=1 Tax=Physcomitrium patens TaxID=3218 RepID=UPI003CCCABB3
MADWEWQDAVQSLIIGIVFAYMCGRLFTLISSIRDQKFRLERGGENAAAPLFTTTFDEQEYAPAAELNVPYAPIEEELDAFDGGDEQVAHGYDSSSSSSDSDYGIERSHYLLATDSPSYSKITSETDGDQAKNIIEDTTSAQKLDDRVDVSDKDSSKVLADEEREDVAEEIEEGNVTDDWEGVESTELEELFGAASTYVASVINVPGAKSSREEMLQLYAYYKIATEGPCSTPQPSAFQPTARAKWIAWQKLGNMSQEEAMQKYVAVLTAIDPTWHQSHQKGKDSSVEATEELEGAFLHSSSKNMNPGPAFSSLAATDDVEGTSTMDALHTCARDGDLQGLSKLLEQGRSIDVKDRGNVSAMEVLVAKGAEIDTKDVEGQTALHHAILSNQEEVAKYLFEHGANINIADKDGNTPLSQCPAHWQWLQRTTG